MFTQLPKLGAVLLVTLGVSACVEEWPRPVEPVHAESVLSKQGGEANAAFVANPAPGLVSQAQLHADSTFAIKKRGSAYEARTVDRAVALRFEEDRVEVTGDRVHAEFRLARIGRPGSVPAAKPSVHRPSVHRPSVHRVSSNRVDYRRHSFKEWYLNGPLGLQQGFTVEQKPAGAELLELEVEVGAALRPVLVGSDIELHDASGATRLFYGGVRAMDSEGVSLPAALAAVDQNILIRVADQGAAYPIVIDPIILTEVAALEASDAAAQDEFSGTPGLTAGGPTVAIDGDAALVASTYDGGRAGSVYVFRNTAGTWAEEAILPRPAGLDANARFGYSIALEGDTAVIGAPLPSSVAGQAFVYTHSGGVWTERATLDGVTAGDNFGCAVAINAGRIVVGARYAADVGGRGGAAYVYEGSGASWTLEQQLRGGDTGLQDDFGSAVAIEGATVAVGSVFHPAASREGAVYVFSRSGTVWTESEKLQASDKASLDLFSRSLSLEGGRLLVGAPQNQTTLFNQGAAYVFRDSGGTWVEDAILLASSPAERDEFGYAVAIDQSFALIGARFADATGANNAGLVYAFRDDAGSWTDETPFSRSGASAGERFGDSVALSGVTAIVGAPFQSSTAARAGGANILELCDGCLISGECIADGALDPTSACRACDPALSNTAYSELAVGTLCGAAVCDSSGRLIPAPTCAAGGVCQTAGPMDCPGALCSDGACCDTACDSVCESCDLVGSEGTCSPIPLGEDPDNECTLACDGNRACMPTMGSDAGPDAGGADGGLDASIDAGVDGGSSDDDSGCSCSASAPVPWSGVFLFLVMLGGLARRRHGSGRQRRDG